MRFLRFIALNLLFAFNLCATLNPQNLPWFTGPMISPSRQILEPGEFLFQPLVFVFDINGHYDENWKAQRIPTITSVVQLNVLEVGITPYLDLQAIPIWEVNHSQGVTTTRFSDFEMALNIQILRDDEDPRFPSLLIQLREIFPTGQYQKLDPNKHFTDISGRGSFVSEIFTTFGKVVHITGDRYISSRLALGYAFPSSTGVEGLNFYGGGVGTKGTVRPGNFFEALASTELSVTHHWALVGEAVYFSKRSDKFHGDPGFTEQGCIAKVGLPSQESFSIAPAVEYAFSNNLGLIGGVWITLFGRNADRFTSYVISFAGVF